MLLWIRRWFLCMLTNSLSLLLDKLWEAPEVLRQSIDFTQTYNLQKADVYSFAIVMFEICGRLGPFGTFHNELDNESMKSKYKSFTI